MNLGVHSIMTTYKFLSQALAFVAAFAVTAAGAQSAPATTTSRIAEEPIVFPKIDAGRVTSKVNDKVLASEAQNRIEIARANGTTTVRVNPEGAPSYVLSNQQPAGVSLRRDQESLRIPLWQLGKF
jgi:hypothetical protein